MNRMRLLSLGRTNMRIGIIVFIYLLCIDATMCQVGQQFQGIRIPGLYQFGQSSSAIEMEVSSNSYNAIRAFNGAQHLATLHFFDDNWYNGNTSKSAGTLNIDVLNGLTLGGWNNPQVYFRRSDGNVGIGTTNPDHKLHINGSDAKIRVEGSIAGAISLQHNGYPNNPIFEWQSVSGRIRLNYIDDLVVKGDLFTVSATGNVGIGTTTPDAKLTVKGDIHAEEVTVDLSVPGPDYVFEEDYKLTTLGETESYIKANKHLPEIPSAKEMEEKGIDLGEMNMLLLKKIEELTLHQIEFQKENERQSELIKKLQLQLKADQ